MSYQKLVADIVTFANYLVSNTDSIQRLLEKLEKSLRIVYELLLTLSTIKDVQLPRNVIKKYPAVHENVSYCLRDLINDEIFDIRLSIQSMEKLLINMRTTILKVERCATQTKWSEVPPFVSSFIEITEWMETCWRHFQIINFNVLTAIKKLHCNHDINSYALFKDVMEICDHDKVYIFNYYAIQALLIFSNCEQKLR